MITIVKKYLSLFYGNIEQMEVRLAVAIFAVAGWCSKDLGKLDFIKFGKDKSTLGGLGFYYVGFRFMPWTLDIFEAVTKSYLRVWLRYYLKRDRDYFETLRAMDCNSFVPLYLNEVYRHIIYEEWTLDEKWIISKKDKELYRERQNRLGVPSIY
jgi:hypothetical protein